MVSTSTYNFSTTLSVTRACKIVPCGPIRARIVITCAKRRTFQPDPNRSVLKRGPSFQPKQSKKFKRATWKPRSPAPSNSPPPGTPLLSNLATAPTEAVAAWKGGYLDASEELVWTCSSQDTVPSRDIQQRQVTPPPTVVTRIPDHIGRSVIRNALILIDKPPQWTAAECVRSLRWALKIRTLGHSGSLDSYATGVVVIMTGMATKLTKAFEQLDREYSGVIRLGQATTTMDGYGKLSETLPWRQITDAQIQKAVASLHGEIMQVPPPNSSIKYKGKPLYTYAAKGKYIELPPRPAYVKEFKVERDEGSPDLRFKLVVARGTSVKALAHELGQLLGTVAHLSQLRREAIGGFRVADAWTLDTLVPLVRKYQPAFRDA